MTSGGFWEVSSKNIFCAIYVISCCYIQHDISLKIVEGVGGDCTWEEKSQGAHSTPPLYETQHILICQPYPWLGTLHLLITWSVTREDGYLFSSYLLSKLVISVGSCV